MKPGSKLALGLIFSFGLYLWGMHILMSINDRIFLGVMLLLVSQKMALEVQDWWLATKKKRRKK